MVKDHRKSNKKETFVTGKNRKPRPKTFKSEESANAYAKKMKYKSYTLENLKYANSTTKKIRIKVN